MCGIAGCIGKKDVAKIDRMLDALLHRGPDDRGTYTFPGGVLGHTRLSIVDVAGGHQPMVRNNGKTGIVCNGEIYNFKEIQKNISSRIPFETNSDTEAVLNLYRQKGPDCIHDLDGMFAFAVIDGEDVMLARDPVGIKPLYYGYHEVFAGYQYMKNFPLERIQEEARRCIRNLHNINLQRADRMGMFFSLELRVPFLDADMLALAQQIPAELKIREVEGTKIEKWILRKAFEGTGYLPDDILWRFKVQYTQGAGCESLGQRLAEEEISDDEYMKIKETNPKAVINSKEAAYYYKIFRSYHPQDSILNSIGIWTGFDFAEEREKVRGSMDTLSHAGVNK